MSDPSERNPQRPDKSLVVFNHAQIAIHTTILLGRALRLRARNRYESWRLKFADSFVNVAHSAWPRLLTCFQDPNRKPFLPLITATTTTISLLFRCVKTVFLRAPIIVAHFPRISLRNCVVLLVLSLFFPSMYTAGRTILSVGAPETIHEAK